jgi:hypothetical protein
MAYAIYSEHPESSDRKAADFTAWSLWAADNAPWTGVGVPEVASILQGVCHKDGAEGACAVLDLGGTLTPEDVRKVIGWASGRMSEKTKEVFAHAAQHGYPVRVVFSKAFGALSASAYLAKHGST